MTATINNKFRHVSANMEILAISVVQEWTPCEGSRDDDAATRLLRTIADRVRVRWCNRAVADCKISIAVENLDGATITLGGENGKTAKALLQEGAKDLINATLVAGEGGTVEVTASYQGSTMVMGCTFISTYDTAAPWEAFVTYRYHSVR